MKRRNFLLKASFAGASFVLLPTMAWAQEEERGIDGALPLRPGIDPMPLSARPTCDTPTECLYIKTNSVVSLRYCTPGADVVTDPENVQPCYTQTVSWKCLRCSRTWNETENM